MGSLFEALARDAYKAPKRDELIEKEQTVRLHRVLARSEIELIRQAGHMVHHADPEALARTVHDWQRPISRVVSHR